jgi:uncharacterized membrane protein YdbT with pleckstrin-like domain
MMRAEMAEEKTEETSQPDYEFPGQHPGEKVYLVFRQHPIVMRIRLIICLTIVTLFAVPLAFWPLARWPWWSLLIGLIVALLVFGHRFIGWYFSVFILTEERLIQISQKGFFNRKVVDIGLNKIQNINYEVKGLQATMFGFGTITVQTYVGNLELRYIHKPERVHQLMVKQMRDFKPANPQASTEMAAEGAE